MANEKIRVNSNDSKKPQADGQKAYVRPEDREKVYVPSMNKIASIRRVEYDPIWGPQLLVSTYSHEWGPEYHWVMGEKCEKILNNRTSAVPQNKNGIKTK